MDREDAVRLLTGGEDGIKEWNERVLNGKSEQIPDLSAADLSWASLIGARLCGASLIGANLCRTDLSGADLRAADLRKANLLGANPTGADFSKARVHETVFADLDLSDAIGLDSCVHFGPSILDPRTLARSKRLPNRFLRGCGLSDMVIENLPSLFGDPMQLYSCFFSHSSKDHNFAKRLHTDLDANGARCWFAPEDLRIGDPVRETIDQAIRTHERLVLVLSGSSIESDWVEHEVERALEEEKSKGATVLFPIRIDDAVMSVEFGWAKRIRAAHEPTGRHIGDFTNWKDRDSYQNAFDRLWRDLKTQAAKIEEGRLRSDRLAGELFGWVSESLPHGVDIVAVSSGGDEWKVLFQGDLEDSVQETLRVRFEQKYDVNLQFVKRLRPFPPAE